MSVSLRGGVVKLAGARSGAAVGFGLLIPVTALTAGRRQDGRQLRGGVDGLSGNAVRQRTRQPRRVRHRAQRKSRRRLRRCRAASHPGRSSSGPGEQNALANPSLIAQLGRLCRTRFWFLLLCSSSSGPRNLRLSARECSRTAALPPRRTRASLARAPGESRRQRLCRAALKASRALGWSGGRRLDPSWSPSDPGHSGAPKVLSWLATLFEPNSRRAGCD